MKTVPRERFSFLYILVDFPSRGDRENQRGIPDSAESGQPARLDRAGSQTRTRLSPAGEIGAVLYFPTQKFAKI